MTFTDGGEPAEQEPSSVLHSAILWVFLQPSILKAAVLSITLSALYYMFFCRDFSLHSFLNKLLKLKILHAFTEAAGAKEMAVTVLPPISEEQQEWSLRVKLDLQVL